MDIRYIKLRNFLFFFFSLLFSLNNSTAQTGPGGVGTNDGTSNLQLWLNGNNTTLSGASVTQWLDLSGNGNDLSQLSAPNQPVINSSWRNGMPAITFAGNENFLEDPDGENYANGLNGFSAFIVFQSDITGTDRGLFISRTPNGGDNTFTLRYDLDGASGNQPNVLKGSTGGSGSFETSANMQTTTPQIISYNWSTGNLPSINFQGLVNTFSNGGASNGPTAGADRFIIGQGPKDQGGADGWDGEIAEFVLFRNELNLAQINAIQNYLSAKYDITLSVNDFYAGDDAGNGNYDFDVIAIGTDANGSQLLSVGDGLNLEQTSGAFGNGDYVMAGHSNAAKTASTANLTGSVTNRWNRDWYLDKTGALADNTNISFDFSEGVGGNPPADLANYVLLYRAANSGNYAVVSTASTSLTGGDQVTFEVADANLSDGYYTIGTTDNTLSPIGGTPSQTWYAFKTGNWNDPGIWTLDGSGALETGPAGEIPSPTDGVVILNTRIVDMIDDNINVASLEVIGDLNLAATSGHDFTAISGNGTIRLSGAAGIDNFPNGNVVDFADSTIGGTVEYRGTGVTLNQSRLYNNVILNLSNAADELVLMNNLIVNGDLTITRGTFQINDDASTTTKNLTVRGDALVDTNGRMTVGQGNTANGFSIPGTLPAVGSYHSIFHQIIFEGNLTNQGSMRFTNQAAPVYNQFTSTGGATVRFTGAANNTASLFGVSDFYNLVIDKGTDRTFELEINSAVATNFGLYGPNNLSRVTGAGFTSVNAEVRKALFIQNGTLHLTGNIEIPTLGEGGSDYSIGGNGALWIDGANVNVYSTAEDNTQVPAGAVGVNGASGQQAFTLWGGFRISAGSLDTRNSGGFIFRNDNAGDVLIEGGTVNVSQFRSSVTGANGIITYTQTGGDVLVRANEGRGGETSGAYYLFSLETTNAVFNMSGGTLIVYGNIGGAIFINSAAGNFNVTNGDVIVENRGGNIAVISTTVPFYNLTLGGDANQIDLISGTSGDNTITNPRLRVLNDFTIETGIIFDHNGNDVEVGRDFTVALGATYLFAETKPSTLTLNGVDNSKIALLNIDGGGGVDDVQRFYNLTIDKPHGTVISLESSKTGGEFNGYQNNLFRVDGEAFKLLSGTLDQGRHSILVNCDTLLNYDVLTVYNESLGTGGANAIDANFNGNNDQIKLAANQGGPTDITLITADTAVIGNLKFYMLGFVVNLNSDLTIQYLEHNNGRFNIQDNNLKVTYYNENVPGGAGTLKPRGLEDMIVTNGNSSDGGLSLAVNANTSYTFPIGKGLTGASPSKYTPATVTVTNFSDDGFITIRPVDKILNTTLGSGGAILSYYWKVGFEGFTTNPTVTYNFTYSEDDLDGDLVIVNSFVAGKVLEVIPFTRRFEDDNITGVPGSVQNEGVNAGTNVITFNGDADAGFTLESASYTAGVPARFVGAPQVFYNTLSDYATWNTGTKWSSTDDGIDDAVNAVPGNGDIVVLRSYGNANQNHWVNVNIDISIARLEFDNSLGGWDPRLWVTKRNAVLDLGNVSGTGEIYLEAITNQQPTFSSFTDIGDFAQNPESIFNFKIDTDNATVTLPVQFAEYPRLRIEADDGGGDDNNRILQTSRDITINGDVRMDRSSRFRVSHDITIKDDLRVTWQGNRTTFEISDDREIVVTVEGDVRLENGEGNDESRILVKNDIQNGYNHRFRVGGNIEIENVTVGASVFDLYNGPAPNNNAVLEFINTGTNTFTNASALIPDLYRIEMNKGVSKANSMRIDTDFVLNGPTSGPGIAKAIEINNGILQLNNSSINVNLTTGDDDFNIPASGGLQITQGTANVSGNDSGITLDGSIIIDGGTLDMSGAGNGNNFIEYSASGSAKIDISSGNLTVGSQIRESTITSLGILNYTQTGGTVIVGQNAAPVAGRGVFEVKGTGSNFTYTGGTLTLVRQNGVAPAVAALRILPSSYEITETIFIGNGSTPINQDNFGINSSVPLAGLTIQGANSPIATIQVNNLELRGDLTVNAANTLNANTKTLTLGANFVNNGTYTPALNTTIFNSAGVQSLSGASATTFDILTKQNTGTLNILDNDIIVNDNFRHEEGVIDDNGNVITLLGLAADIEGTHQSGAGGGLRFAGTTQQQLRRLTSGRTDLGIVTIANANGLVIPESNGYNFNINGELQMNGGIFNIGSSEVVIGQNAEITTNSAFGVDNMVKTNSSFTDNGLTKVFPANYSSNFIFPIGEEFYTPVEFDFSIGGGTSGSTVGSISARPANEPHPTVIDIVGGYASEINNVLQYYWTVRSSGINGLVADVDFSYDQSDVLAADAAVTEATYIAARILAFDNANEDINKYTIDEVDEATNTISFPASLAFNGVGSNGISGDYFAGDDDAIPNNVATYTTLATLGDVTNTTTYIEGLPTDGVAPSGAVLVVSTGTEVTFNVDNVRLYKTIIQDGGTLNIDDTDGHRLGILEGTGNLKITSSGANANVPAADYGDFFSCAGGGLEYAGTGDYGIIGNIPGFGGSLRNLTLSGSGDRNFPNSNVTICEDLVVDGPVVNTYSNKKINLYGGLTLNSGVLNFTTGSVSRLYIWAGDLIINGGSFNAGSAGGVLVIGDTYLNGGNLNMGWTPLFFAFRGNIEISVGALNAQTSNVYLNSNLDVQRLIGDFTGSNSFYNLIIDNRDGIQNYEFEGDVEISSTLSLTDGIINTNGNKVILNSSASVSETSKESYINGRVVKTISNMGGSFTFPIGSSNHWRPVQVKNVSVGGLAWEAEYYEGAATIDPLVSNLTPASTDILTMSSVEYWKISDGAAAPAGVTANVGLSWGDGSFVSSVKLEREQMELMAWNSASSSWDNYGGGSFSSGHSQTEGSFTSVSPISFSENIVTLGSTDLANPLPVELLSFTAKEHDGQVLLAWKTASEQNNDFFLVEHSVDGKVFTEIGTVFGAGTTTVLQKYAFEHSRPSYPDNYYRLKQVDFDGAFEYSDVILVRLKNALSSAGMNFVMYPNPTTDAQVSIEITDQDVSKPLMLEVIGLSGNKIKTEMFSAGEFNHLIQLNLDYVAKQGVYIVRLSQGEQVVVKRLILK